MAGARVTGNSPSHLRHTWPTASIHFAMQSCRAFRSSVMLYFFLILPCPGAIQRHRRQCTLRASSADSHIAQSLVHTVFLLLTILTFHSPYPLRLAALSLLFVRGFARVAHLGMRSSRMHRCCCTYEWK